MLSNTYSIACAFYLALKKKHLVDKGTTMSSAVTEVLSRTGCKMFGNPDNCGCRDFSFAQNREYATSEKPSPRGEGGTAIAVTDEVVRDAFFLFIEFFS